jgi:pimeloyl-ACP methyl ester carboxylesterase
VTALCQEPGGEARANRSGPGKGCEPAAETALVDGVPMSALVNSVPRPRAVVVALHGGAVTSAYYDAQVPARSSMLRVGAALGFTVIALDRPGYGASASYGERMAAVSDRLELAYGAIDALLAERSRGAGVFVMAHSMGCVLAVQMAADPRGTALLGLEIAGTGRVPHPDAAFMGQLTGTDSPHPGQPRRPRRSALREALWTPGHLYPPGTDTALGYAPAPDYEGADVRGWIAALPALAARVAIPVHYTLGDHERVWSAGPSAVADIASLFVASPRVVTATQRDAAHNLSLGWSALSYHLKVLSFVEECVLRREHDGAESLAGDQP